MLMKTEPDEGDKREVTIVEIYKVKRVTNPHRNFIF